MNAESNESESDGGSVYMTADSGDDDMDGDETTPTNSPRPLQRQLSVPTAGFDFQSHLPERNAESVHQSSEQPPGGFTFDRPDYDAEHSPKPSADSEREERAGPSQLTKRRADAEESRSKRARLSTPPPKTSLRRSEVKEYHWLKGVHTAQKDEFKKMSDRVTQYEAQLDARRKQIEEDYRQKMEAWTTEKDREAALWFEEKQKEVEERSTKLQEDQEKLAQMMKDTEEMQSKLDHQTAIFKASEEEQEEFESIVQRQKEEALQAKEVARQKEEESIEIRARLEKEKAEALQARAHAEEKALRAQAEFARLQREKEEAEKRVREEEERRLHDQLSRQAKEIEKYKAKAARLEEEKADALQATSLAEQHEGNAKAEFTRLEQKWAEKEREWQAELARVQIEKEKSEREWRSKFARFQEEKQKEMETILRKQDRAPRLPEGSRGSTRPDASTSNSGGKPRIDGDLQPERELPADPDFDMDDDQSTAVEMPGKNAPISPGKPSTSAGKPSTSAGKPGPSKEGFRRPRGTNWNSINARAAAKAPPRGVIMEESSSGEEEEEEEEEEETDKAARKKRDKGKHPQKRERDGSEGDEEDNDETDEDDEEGPLTKKGLMKMMQDVVKTTVRQMTKKSPPSSKSPKSRSSRRSKKVEELEAEKKEDETIIKTLARVVMKEAFGVEALEDYMLHDPPSEEDIRRFEAGEEGSGPNPEDLRIDMGHKMRSNWNKKVLEILGAAVQEKLKAEAWEELPQRSDAYIRDLMYFQVQRAKGAWCTAQPQLKDNGELETLEEVEKRMVDGKENKGKYDRAGTRRKGKYDRRMRTIADTIAKKKERGEEAQHWEYLHTLFDRLGEDGMSSEESDVVNAEEVLYVKTMYWRVNLENEVQVVDSQRKDDPGLFSKKGMKPIRRIRDGTKGKTRRAPPTEYPKSFYEPEWLEGLTKKARAKLEISDEKFKLKHIKKKVSKRRA